MVVLESRKASTEECQETSLSFESRRCCLTAFSILTTPREFRPGLGLLVRLGIPKYMNIFLWELAVNFNGYSYAGNKTGKVVPAAHGNLILIIFERIKEVAYKTNQHRTL